MCLQNGFFKNRLNLYRKKELKVSNEQMHRMTFASVYPHYVKKAEKKGRKKNDVDKIIFWLTGFSKKELAEVISNGTDFENFFKKAPSLNDARHKITGSICGVKIQEIKDPVVKEIRYLDKLIDELAKGKPMEKILRV